MKQHIYHGINLKRFLMVFISRAPFAFYLTRKIMELQIFNFNFSGRAFNRKSRQYGHCKCDIVTRKARGAIMKFESFVETSRDYYYLKSIIFGFPTYLPSTLESYLMLCEGLAQKNKCKRQIHQKKKNETMQDIFILYGRQVVIVGHRSKGHSTEYEIAMPHDITSVGEGVCCEILNGFIAIGWHTP